MNPHHARILTGGWFLLLLVLPGCGGGQKPALTLVPAYAPSPSAIWRLKRVVLVELDRQGAPQELARSLSESIHRAVGERNAFPVEFAPACGRLPESVRPCQGPRLTLEQLAEMRSSLKCDAVLIGAVTGFDPYPEARLAVQLWLVDLRSGRLLWGVDHSWQVSDPVTAEKMQWYFDTPGRGEVDDSIRLAQMSPRALGDFVAWDLARSLPAPPGAAGELPRRGTGDRVCEAARNICTN